MRKQRFLAVLLSAALAFTPVIDVMAEENASQTEEDSSTGKTEESREVNQTEVGEGNNEPQNYGAIISDNANNVPVYENDVEAYTELPASYQLDKEKYPDVRNQGSYGTCWSFAALGLSEFDLINKGLADKSIDLSELQLAYFVYNSAIDPLGGTVGDQSKYYKDATSYSYLDRGGMYEYAVRRLSQWSGVVNESDVPYNTENINNVLNNGLSDEYAYSKDVAHLENAYVMSLKNNSDDVKRAIMDKGAVGVQYYHSNSRLLWNSEKQIWTYYDPAITGGGHNVMIVGWDDDFATDNFVGNKPTHNGAWLIRNSWGFQQSYFWMSYENQSLLDAAWVFDMNTADNYDNNYQLDGGIDSYNVSNQICQYKTYSNVFNVQEKEGIASENLEAVSLSFTHVADVNYKVEVYTDLKDSNPYSGTKQEVATTEGTTTYAGLYTIPLKESVQLTPGSSFSIVVTTDKYSLDYEQGINWEKDGVKVWDAPVSLNSGKSFYGNSNYQWSWYWGNFCIKAFTTNNRDFGEKIKGTSATLNGSIDMNLYVDIPKNSELMNDQDAYIEFTVNGNISKVKVSNAEETEHGKKFTCPVVAKEMTSEIQVRFVSEGERSQVYTYTVKDYAEKILNDSTGLYSDEAKNLVKAMLNYGASAQTYFGYNTEKLANEKLSDDDKNASFGDFNFTDYKPTWTPDKTVTGIKYYGSSLNLNTNTNVKNYFELEDEHTIDEYIFSYTTKGKTCEVTPVQKTIDDKELYLIEIPDIKAYLLNEKIVVTIKSKAKPESTGIKMSYSPFSYCYAASELRSDKTKTSLVNLTKSLYWYWDKAYKYMKATNS